jgi:hypothetical protein
MAPEHQRGRWMLWEIAKSGQFPPTDSDDFYLINRTLGTLDKPEPVRPAGAYVPRPVGGGRVAPPAAVEWRRRC